MMDPKEVIAALSGDGSANRLSPKFDLATSLTSGDSELSGLIDLAAVPRSFDAALLASLAGLEQHSPEFTRPFAQLIRMPMVQERGVGSWAIHDSIRRSLLAAWAEKGPEALDEQLVRLRQLHDERYDKAESALPALGQVEDLVRSVNERRYLQLREGLEQRLVRSSLDAVNTALRISYQQGLREFQEKFDELQSAGFTEACELLVRGWAQDAGLVQPDQRRIFIGWGRYHLGRVLMRRELYAEALDVFDGIEEARSPDESTARFASLVSSERSRALSALSRFDEAFAEFQRRIDLNEDFHQDDDNITNCWLDRAELHGLLLDTARAKSAAARALDVATRQGGDYNRAFAHSQMARATCATGERREALAQLLQALFRSRLYATSGASALYTKSAALDATRAAIEIVGPLSRRSLATLVEQRRQLTRSAGDSAALSAARECASALATGGDRRGACNAFDEARKLASDRQPARLWEVDADEAQYGTVLGLPHRALEQNLELLDDPRFARDPWTRGRAATNGLIIAIGRGDFLAAERLVDVARHVWRDLGVDRALQMVNMLEGDLLRRRGELAAARRTLLAVPPTGNLEIDGEHAEFLARLDDAEASYDSAADHAREGLADAKRLRDVHSILSRGALAVDCLGRAGRFAEAAGPAADLQDMVAAVQAYTEWRPDAATATADAHVARALWILVFGLGSPSARTASAIEHLELAAKSDPSGAWCQLEIAWLNTINQNHRRARAHVTAAADMLHDDDLKAAVLDFTSRV